MSCRSAYLMALTVMSQIGVRSICAKSPSNLSGINNASRASDNTEIQRGTGVISTASLNSNCNHIEDQLSNIYSIPKLQNWLENIGKPLCYLQTINQKPCLYDGVLDADYLVVGEAPGQQEAEQCKPFVGQSGKLLQWLLDSAGINRKTNLYVTNTVPWRPPGNRKPNKLEINQCLPVLERQIQIINPKAILLCGSTPLNAVLGSKLEPKDTISKVRGKVFYEKYPIIPTFHPAYILRNQKQKKFLWQDILRFKSLVTESN